jgi:hypothetical protein
LQSGLGVYRIIALAISMADVSVINLPRRARASGRI